MSSPRVWFRTPRSNADPIAAMAGTTINSAASGCRPMAVVTVSPKLAARTMRSPWAMLTSRMTPKISESPAAKSA